MRYFISIISLLVLSMAFSQNQLHEPFLVKLKRRIFEIEKEINNENYRSDGMCFLIKETQFSVNF